MPQHGQKSSRMRKLPSVTPSLPHHFNPWPQYHHFKPAYWYLQLAPVAQKPLSPTLAAAPSNTASANAKAATGSRASAMIKAMASAANKAAGKLKSTAPSSGPTPAKATKTAEGASGTKQSAPQKAKPESPALKPAATPATAGELKLNDAASEHDLFYSFKQCGDCKLENSAPLFCAVAHTTQQHAAATTGPCTPPLCGLVFRCFCVKENAFCYGR